MALWLEGVKVLDLTRLLPGPFCTLLLADMGADVIKIEDTRGGDYARYYPPMVGESSAFFAALNRNKRSMVLDLKSEAGVEIFRSLVAEADVVIESFRPGVMDRLGVGYETLRELNPRLVYCAISGFGQTGPLRDRAGHDATYLARAGVLDQNGRHDSGPHVPGFQLADIGGGALYAATGILGALFGRERSNEGAFIDISMTEGALSFALHALAGLEHGATQARGEGMLTGGVPCYNVYETADSRHLAVGPLEPKFWGGFLQAIDRVDLLADGLSDGEEGRKVQAEIAGVLREKTLAQWREIFAACDVCVEPVLTYEEVLEDELMKAREVFFRLAGVLHTRTPLTPSGREHTPAPEHGEHTREILAELGYDESRVEELHAAGVI